MIELYHRTDDEVSKRVRDFIEDNDLHAEIDFYEVSGDEEAQRQLLALTGSHQVPCLVIDGEALLESEEIISWLEENMLAKRRRGPDAHLSAGL